MAFLGIKSKKEKCMDLKKEIAKQLDNINSTDAETNRTIIALQELVTEHQVKGDKGEDKILDDLLQQVNYLKQCVNTGKTASAKTAVGNITKKIQEEWGVKVGKDAYVPEKDAQFDIDNAIDEQARLLKEKDELYAFLTAHPEQQANYAAKWNNLMDNIDAVNERITIYSNESMDENAIEIARGRHQVNAEVAGRQKASNEEIDALIAQQEKDNARMAERADKMAELRNSMSSNRAELRGFQSEASKQAELRGFENNTANREERRGVQDPGRSTLRGFGAAQKADDTPIEIETAIKNIDKNLAKFEAANDDLKDQLAEKDREYNRIKNDLVRMLQKRQTMAPAEYNTIDYKIDEAKIALQSLAKEKQAFQNVLAQNNLKMTVLKQLRAERDLNVMAKYNIDTMSMEDIAAYLSSKNTEKNESLDELDTLTQTILGDQVNSSTGTADGLGNDLGEISGDKDKYDDLMKSLGIMN